jgi:hypothetical protein
MAQQQAPRTTAAKSNVGQIVGLVVIAVVLGAGYLALDFYTAGEKNKTIAESRGTQLVQALSKYRLESNAYPDSLAKLSPKYLASVPACPAGEPFSYQGQGADYTLGCSKVAWNSKPYSYSSKTRIWQE